MSFVSNYPLHCLCSPVVEFLFLRTAFFALGIQVFEHDYVSRVKRNNVNNELGCLMGYVKIHALGSCPQPWHFPRTMLLCFFDFVQLMI